MGGIGACFQRDSQGRLRQIHCRPVAFYSRFELVLHSGLMWREIRHREPGWSADLALAKLRLASISEGVRRPEWEA